MARDDFSNWKRYILLSVLSERIGEHDDGGLQEVPIVPFEECDDLVNGRACRHRLIQQVAGERRPLRAAVVLDLRRHESIEPQALVVHAALGEQIVVTDVHPAVPDSIGGHEPEPRARIVRVFVVADQDMISGPGTKRRAAGERRLVSEEEADDRGEDREKTFQVSRHTRRPRVSPSGDKRCGSWRLHLEARDPQNGELDDQHITPFQVPR